VRVSKAFQRPACGVTASGKKNLRTNQDKLENLARALIKSYPVRGRIVEINI
jgi:hypothetical protein